MTRKKGTGNENIETIRDPNTREMFDFDDEAGIRQTEEKEPETKIIEELKRGRGRPRKYAADTERVQAFRNRKLKEGRRLDVYVNDQVSWRVRELGEAWGCGVSEVFERLVMEADQYHRSILFPADG